MEIKVFSHPHFLEKCHSDLYRSLTKDFIEYKRTGIRPTTFGRDTPYDRPSSVKNAKLQHIHIKDSTSTNWHLRHVQVFNMKSNTALIYCNGFRNENYYLLISFLENAHSYYGGTELYLRTMAEYAEEFRAKF